MRLSKTLYVKYNGEKYEVQIFTHETTDEIVGIEVWKGDKLMYSTTIPPYLDKLDEDFKEEIIDKIYAKEEIDVDV